MFEDVAHILEQYKKDQTIPSGGWIMRLRDIHQELGLGIVNGGCSSCVTKMMARLIERYESTRSNGEGRSSLPQDSKPVGKVGGRGNGRNKRSKS